jgi:hypothetical protein
VRVSRCSPRTRNRARPANARAARRRRPCDREVAAGSRVAVPAPPGSSAPTPSVSATAFVGNRPDRAPAQQQSFCPRGGERLPKDLNPRGSCGRASARAPGHAPRAGAPGRRRLPRCRPGPLPGHLGHPLPPLEQQVWPDAVLVGHERDRHAGLERLLDQPDLLRHRPPPAALHRRDHLDALALFTSPTRSAGRACVAAGLLQ